MRGVEINIFGCPAMRVDGAPSVALDLSPTGAALFGLLALQASARPMRREAISDALWPDCPPARQRARLRTALWRLGNGFPDWGPDVIQRAGDAIRLALPPHVRLVHDGFEIHVARLCARPVLEMSDEDFTTLDTWLQRYRGPLLDGVDGDWLMVDRTRFADIYCQGLAHQISFLRDHGRDHETIRAGQKLLTVDPYREDAHEALIGSYCRTGRPDRAERQLRISQALFETDLGLQPARPAPAAGVSQRPFSKVDQDMARLLGDMQRSLERMAEQLAQMQRSLERQDTPRHRTTKGEVQGV